MQPHGWMFCSKCQRFYHRTLSILSIDATFQEAFERLPTMTLENATLVVKEEDGYAAIGDCGVELSIDRAYGEKPGKNFRLTLRVTP